MRSAAVPIAVSRPEVLHAPAFQLFTLSFAALFLELMVIRWVPSEIRLVAYYANLMLVSSFLGLGIGAILSTRSRNLFRWFPYFLALYLVFLVLVGEVSLPGSSGEFRFGLGSNIAFSYAALVVIFVLNALVFVPIGEQIGALFQQLPVLRAYVWDLIGSLAGTLAFGAFSLLHFSPLLGIAIVIALVFFTSGPRGRGRAMIAYAVALAAIFWSGQRQQTWWSPYYFITVHENRVQTEQIAENMRSASYVERPANVVPPDLRTMADPPLYNVRVNQDFYQMHGSIDLARYTPGSADQRLIAPYSQQYSLPFHVIKNPRTVLVLGAGGGMDTEAALLHGAERVDAVEIDPLLPKLSRRFNAADPYSDPRVVLHIEDAREFLQKNKQSFDLVMFGHLDSQALFSYGTNVRLDGFIYTVEGFKSAFARVAPGGVMSVSFIAAQEWLIRKFAQMLEAATGSPSLIYFGPGTITFIASKQSSLNPPAEIGEWKLHQTHPLAIAPATDDWPYLYLKERGVPTDYAVVISVLLVISLGALVKFRGTAMQASDGHFLFMGWGFLLLQTKSIGDCSLYFGTTWLVTMLVIAGVLIMVLLANWVALRWVRRFRFWLYVPLFASLGLVIAIPRDLILAQSLGWRISWTIFMVPLPIFFAGLIFSTTFREARSAPLALGANLIGATLGGFSEYLGMWTGSQALSLLVVIAYACSLLCMIRQCAAARSRLSIVPTPRDLVGIP